MLGPPDVGVRIIHPQANLHDDFKEVIDGQQQEIHDDNALFEAKISTKTQTATKTILAGKC